jgi:hypothetical protein
MISKMVYIFSLFLILSSCQSDNVNNDKEVATSEVYVAAINITGSDISAGTTTQLTAEISPANASNKAITWSTSDASIAQISQDGLLTALKNGSVTITATAKDKGVVSKTRVITISNITTTTIPGYRVTNTAELVAAFSKVKPGEIIVLNGGTYVINEKINITISGTSDKPINLIVKEGESRPKLDFSAMPESSSNQGIVLDANYWHIKGIDIFKAGDNGMQVKGSNNIIEFCSFSECSDTGLQIDNGASNNTILNCDSYFNADSSLENADGFACKLTAGTGNKFIGCRAWQNLDDGWDGYLRGTDNITTTYENCWAIKNGYLKNGTKGQGDGNGFKTGGSDDKLLKHNAKYTNCIAAGNITDGFDHNSNRGEVIIYNCSAYSNGKNYSFSSTNPLAKLTIKNCNALDAYGSTSATLVDATNNSWQNGIIVSATDFKSIDFSELLTTRKPDGSLPDVNFFHLTATSSLIDKGINVGLLFKGAAPDIGAFEY